MNIKLYDKVKVVKHASLNQMKELIGMEGVVVQKRGVYSQVRLYDGDDVLWFEDVELEVLGGDKNED